MDEDVGANILSYFPADPHSSLRGVSADAGAPSSSVWRLLRSFNLHLYHVQLHSKLDARDVNNRTDFAN